MLSSSQLQELSSVFSGKISEAEADLDKYGTDATRSISRACLLVFPENKNQLIALVDFARKHSVALVPSGGRTGLSAAAVAQHNEIIVSFEKMNRILRFDAMQQLLWVEPGVTTQQVQAFAEEKNLFYPVDLASSGSCQIGGNIATNAGGIHVHRYGMTREQLRGLEVVTGGGELLQLNNGLVKNNAAYDLMQLFVGSEGTLGFITEACLKLQLPPQQTQLGFFAVQDFADAQKLYVELNRQFALQAVEFLDASTMQQVESYSGKKQPFHNHHQLYVLLEAECESEVFATSLEKLSEQNMFNDAVVAHSLEQQKAIWLLRELSSDALSSQPHVKFDICLRLEDVVRFITDVKTLLIEIDARIIPACFGHLADGNVHLNVLLPDETELTNLQETIESKVYQLLNKYEGSVSAEHGIGLLKKNALRQQIGEQQLHYMREIKRVFDPDSILNPGKLFD